MALCNAKENPRIMETNLKNLANNPSNLCHTLDYLLSVSETDALDYWGAVLTKARKVNREAHVKMIPFIINILPKLGITQAESLFCFQKDTVIYFSTSLKSVVESYLEEDRHFEHYNAVYSQKRIKGTRSRNSWNYGKLSTSYFIKTLLGHLGLKVKCQLASKKRSTPPFQIPAKYKITIENCSQTFAILSCIYDYTHWGNFLNISESLRAFDIGQYKSDIVDEFLFKDVEMEQGESLGSQDTLLGGSSSQNSTHSSSMENEMDRDGMDGIEEFFEE